MSGAAVRKTIGRWRLAGVFIAMCTLAGCAAPGGANRQSINVRPIFSYEPAEQGTDYQIQALGPLFLLRRDQAKISLALRPLFFYREAAENDSRELEYLYPLGRSRGREPGDKSVRLIPLFHWGKYQAVDGGEGEERWEFLTLFWGRTREGTEYGGLFPLAGWMSQRFNKDRIRFFLWPLYLDASKDETTTYHILWPLISYTRGGGHKGSKFLPFYSYHEQMADHALDAAAAWPLFTMHKDGESSRWMLLPLVGRSESRGAQTTWVLWPFFSYSVYEFGEQWNLPWPFLNINTGSDRQRVRLFPLFKTERAQGENSFYVLWPLYQFQEFRYPDGWEERHRILLVDGWHTDQRKGKTKKELNFWPLFRYVRERDGSHRLSIPVLLPIEEEGLERNYAPLITLFHQEGKADGTGGWDFLWGLASYRKGEKRSVFELSFLYKYMRQGERVDHWFFGGFIHIPSGPSRGKPLPDQPPHLQ